MKSYFIKFFIYSLLFLGLLQAQELNLSKEEKEWIKNNQIITYSEVNWKPLSIIENNRMNGIMGDFLDIVANKTGLKFKFVASDSWPHVLQQFSDKKIDLVPGIGSSPQETKLGLVSKMYATYPMVIVTSEKYQYLDGLKELENKTVTAPKYYTSYNFIVENYPNINIIATSSITESLLLVEKGKADAFVGHIATSLFYLAENHLENLKVTGTTSFKFEHQYLIQKDKELLLSIINKTFDLISYQEKRDIYSKWIQPTVVQEKIDYTLLFVITGIALLIILFLMYRQHVLKQSHKDMTNILNSSLDGIIISKNNICINANTSAINIFRCTKKELVGIDVLQLIAMKYRKKVIQELSKTSAEPYEVEASLFDGSKIPILIKGTTLIINNEKVRVSSFVDLTETKQKEALFYQQSKMAAMGEMLGNIAHQWRQPLSVISIAASGIRFQKEIGELSDDDLFEAVDEIEDSTKYLSKTIDDFRNFFSPSDKDYVHVNVIDIVEQSFKLVKAQFTAKDINIIKNVDDLSIYTIKNELIQVFVNILNNSRDALLNCEDERYIFINISKVNEDLYIEITDNGGGIDDDILDRVFEPYFTTKHKSQGTGVGLYMVEEIITKHLRGVITIKNKKFNYNGEDLKGACVNITIPLI